MIRGKKICPSMSNPVSMLNTGVRSSPFFLKFLWRLKVFTKNQNLLAQRVTLNNSVSFFLKSFCQNQSMPCILFSNRRIWLNGLLTTQTGLARQFCLMVNALCKDFQLIQDLTITTEEFWARLRTTIERRFHWYLHASINNRYCHLALQWNTIP